jgi:hypothetical protein
MPEISTTNGIRVLTEIAAAYVTFVAIESR